MPDLSGRSCIVTGSTKGIGRAVALALVEAGADVVVSSRTEGDVESTVDEIGSRGPGEVAGVVCDVRDPEACERLVERAVERFGGLDVMVNNAGLGRFGPIQELSVEDWQVQVETNLNGVFYCSKAAAPHLSRDGGGWIVNIGSLASRNSFRGGTGYNASKFGLLGMTEAMMLDLRHDGVRVSLIMPGSVATEFRTPGSSGEEGDEWMLHPEDVARSVVHLLEYPDRALPSRIEMRPTRPPRG